MGILRDGRPRDSLFGLQTRHEIPRRTLAFLREHIASAKPNRRLPRMRHGQRGTPLAAAIVSWTYSAGDANCSESRADLLPTCDMLNQLERLKTSMETLGI